MKVIITIIAVSLLTACEKENKEINSLLIEEIPGYVVVPNTEIADYSKYRKLWTKVNTSPRVENGYKPREEKQVAAIKEKPLVSISR